MRALAAALFLLLATPALAKPDYAPLREGAVYRYAWKYEGRSGEDVLTVKKLVVAGTTVFYFESPGNSIIGANWLGFGGYEVRADSVYTRDAFWLKDLGATTAAAAQLLLPAVLAADFHTVVKGKDHDLTITVRGYEDVTVAAGKFAHCLKLGVDGEGRKGTAWLAPDVGLVKWNKYTGRVQELIALPTTAR